MRNHDGVARRLRRVSAGCGGSALAGLALGMWQILGASVDAVHALIMVAWIAGFPLLLSTQRPRLTRAYAPFSVAFVVVSQVSRFALGECVFTTLARWLWDHASAVQDAPAASKEWFTVRVSRAIFGMAPSHRAVAVTSEVLSLVTAVGVLFAMRRLPSTKSRMASGQATGPGSRAGRYPSRAA